MFTGIIEEMGEIQSLRKAPRGVHVSIRAKKTLSGLRRGGSIAVNGVCLTAISISKTVFSADLSHETLRSTHLGGLQQGEKVNLERPMSLSDRLEGHIVLGHVEGVGVIQSRKEGQNGILLTIAAPPPILKYCIPKGSIAIDGISLTIVTCSTRLITVVIIPHTAQKTTLGIKGQGATVNLETDPIGKYIERFMIQGAKNGAPLKRRP